MRPPQTQEMMNMSNRKLMTVVLVAVGAALVGGTALMAGPAKGEHKTTIEPKITTIEGRIVDIACFMSGQYTGNDRTKCTADCIRNGIPACLETSHHGLI